MSTELLPQLTSEEQSTRDRLEGIVQKLETQFVNVASALLELRDSRLYRSTHSSFKAYVQETFKIGQSQAYRLIEFGKVVQETIENIGSEASPSGGGLQTVTERAARELTRLPSKQRAEALTEAVRKTGGKVTAKAVREAVKPHLPGYGNSTPDTSAYAGKARENDPDDHHVIRAVLADYEARKAVYNQLPLLAPSKIVEMVVDVIRPLL